MAVLATEACKQGLHKLCDGTGTTPGGAPAQCQCPCHELKGGK